MRWNDILLWRDERNKLATLREDLDRTERSFEVEIRSATEAGSSEILFEIKDRRYFEMRTFEMLIDQIETRRRLRLARRYGVPVPLRPDVAVDSEYWDWELGLYEHTLSTKGHYLLRREIAAERELVFKPWLSWVAIILSFLSLIIAAAKAIVG
ncbi:hypothetical protein [Mesorhizobium sp. M0674]|uniref:hypothetical protein n=1 Tax=unclassified Mesorhizobium TaxID=325217 RepID=UPI003334AF6B